MKLNEWIEYGKNVEDYFSERIEYLNRLEKNKRREIKAKPWGSLRIDLSKGSTQYYHYRPDREKKLTYIPKKEKELIQALAQKSYDMQVVKTIEKERTVLKHFLKKYPIKKIEDIYDELPASRKPLVDPIVMTEEEYVKEWLAKGYDRNSYPTDDIGLETEAGIPLRSRAEQIISEELSLHNIPYRCEEKIYLEGYGWACPDFTVLNVRLRKEYHWEHLGLMTDYGYAATNLLKIEAYMENGYYPGENLILSSETIDPISGKPRINVKLIRNFIKRYLL